MAEKLQKPRNVYVDDESWAYAKALAKSQGTTISAIIRQGIGCLFANRDRTATEEKK